MKLLTLLWYMNKVASAGSFFIFFKEDKQSEGLPDYKWKPSSIGIYSL